MKLDDEYLWVGLDEAYLMCWLVGGWLLVAMEQGCAACCARCECRTVNKECIY